jgi:hypothetical protein
VASYRMPSDGDIDAMVEDLKVSWRSRQLGMTELGLTVPALD